MIRAAILALALAGCAALAEIYRDNLEYGQPTVTARPAPNGRTVFTPLY